MEQSRVRHDRSSAGAGIAAAFGCLQPGIDPVFLALLSQAGGVGTASHGMIVGGTQAGAALGSLFVWRLGAALPHRGVAAAAAVALACSLLTPAMGGVGGLLAIRCLYGLCMGVVYAYGMAAYAARRPNQAYGAVFLLQLLLSTLVSLLLPEIASGAGSDNALRSLALAPAVALAALLLMAPAPVPVAGPWTMDRQPVPAAGWALAAATFWFIAATMLVWSFAAVLAGAAGIGNRTIGQAVAIGSLAGAVTAMAVMRERVIVPLPLTGLLCGLALVTPLLLTRPGADLPFLASMVLLNIGSTAIIIRCSGFATASSADPGFRVLVACAHSFGLIAGPLLGSAMVAMLGPDGLLGGVLIALPAGLASILWAALTRRRGNAGSAAPRMALD